MKNNYKEINLKFIFTAIAAAIFYILAEKDGGVPFLFFFFMAPFMSAFALYLKKNVFYVSFVFWCLIYLYLNSWLLHSLSEIFGFAYPVSVFLLFIFTAVFYGLYFAVFTTVSVYIIRSADKSSFLIKTGSLASAACLWAGIEFLRGLIVPAMNIGTKASLFYEYPVMIRASAVTGEHILSAIFAAAGLSLYPLFKNISMKTVIRVVDGAAVIVMLAPLAAVIIYGAAVSHDSLKSAFHSHGIAVQGNNPAEKKWDPEYTEELLENYLVLTREHLSVKEKTVYWPETVLNFYPSKGKKYTETLQGLAESEGITLFAGGPERVCANGKCVYYNAVYRFTGDGFESVYRKEKLIPFAEYSPAEFLYPLFKKIIGETQFSSYRKNRPVQIGEKKAAFIICFESIFPALTAERAEGADFIVVFSDNVWLGETRALRLHLSSTVLRAVENRMPVLLISNSGISALITPNGEIVDLIPYGEKGIIKTAF